MTKVIGLAAVVAVAPPAIVLISTWERVNIDRRIRWIATGIVSLVAALVFAGVVVALAVDPPSGPPTQPSPAGIDTSIPVALGATIRSPAPFGYHASDAVSDTGDTVEMRIRRS